MPGIIKFIALLLAVTCHCILATPQSQTKTGFSTTKKEALETAESSHSGFGSPGGLANSFGNYGSFGLSYGGLGGFGSFQNYGSGYGTGFGSGYGRLGGRSGYSRFGRGYGGYSRGFDSFGSFW